jgi:Arc/MetJ-type ribon-helix-helix transcriptional regulator
MIYYDRKVYEEVNGMKTINVPLPDKLVAEVETYVKSGWFTDEAELMRTALQEFIRHNRLKLMEQFMKEDIEWALKAKAGK